ncbi:NACHT domain-containing protein [Streptomyces sp. NPDC017056]|uniref:NACHT domain-containing protein n=1 Tax=Streptomyces sp. NPDC017056 TaxID=3364973 RepID=UPI00378E96B6
MAHGGAMPGTFCYADAVKLLGGADSRVVTALDRLTGGALLVATGGGSALALSLFDARGELARLSGQLVSGLADRLGGLGRFDRAERLTAAHKVIVLTAYFEALSGTALPFDADELRWDRASQAAVATGEPAGSGRLRALVGMLNESDVPGDSVPVNGEEPADTLRRFYGRLAERLTDYVESLDVWARLGRAPRESFVRTVRDDVTAAALRGYETHLRRLAADCPEVAFWANRLDHGATRAGVRDLHTGLAGLERVLARLASGTPPGDRRDALARRYRRHLTRPIVATGDAPEGLTIPSLAAAYLTPRYRVASVTRAARLDQESWWASLPPREDLEDFLVGHLASVRAVECPLIVLGQPGSGKSVLTKVLAARLPAGDYLTVRVALRDVPADTDVQSQIEYAVRDATGEELSWPGLARSAGRALPVVLLDGFDELLQATGIGQTDYLEHVARFQEREADQGRPVAVIVTSRTAVADRARIPRPGAVALRLEEFADDQIRQWLAVWNTHNAGRLAERGLSPLPPEAVLRQRDLAAQPLLLLMLALYDATDNAFQRHGAELDEADLYERIVQGFAEREIHKTRPELDAGPLRTAVEGELLKLSVAAFTMFNRGRQWATEEELSTDLVALLGDTLPARPGTDFRAPPTPGQTVVSRFFFIHQAQAVRAGIRLTTCEFLHATFGEFLVARVIVRELEDLALVAATRSRLAADDGFLRAVLSFAPLTMRRKVVEFLDRLLGRLPGDRRHLLRGLLLTAFHGALAPARDTGRDGYGPEHVTVPARHAAYSANLLLLIALVGAPEPVTGRELFPRAPFPVPEWRAHALLWRSQFTSEGWHSLAVSLRLEREWREGDREVSVSLGPWIPSDPDGFWIAVFPPGDERRRLLGWRRIRMADLRLESYFTCDSAEDIIWHGLAPLTQTLDGADLAWPDDVEATSAFGVLSEEQAVSATHAMLRLWLTSSSACDGAELQRAYGDCLRVIAGSRPEEETTSRSALLARVLRQLAADRERLATAFLELLREEFTSGLFAIDGTYRAGHPEVRQWEAEAFGDAGDGGTQPRSVPAPD